MQVLHAKPRGSIASPDLASRRGRRGMVWRQIRIPDDGVEVLLHRMDAGASDVKGLKCAITCTAPPRR